MVHADPQETEEKGSLRMIRTELIANDPEIMSGVTVFAGTRVPVKNLFDYIEGGDPLDEFLDDFPTVSREHALAVLELCRGMLDIGDIAPPGS